MDGINSGIIQKLINTVEKGTGGALKPWQIRRVGKAAADIKSYEQLREAQSEVDARAIKDGKKILTDDGQLIWASEQNNQNVRIEPSIGNLSIIESQMHDRQYAQSIQEEINLTKAVLLAQDNLSGYEGKYSDTSVDPDWFVRWRDCAKKVSNERMQQLWADILAEEVKWPNAFSLRALEFIRNISHEEASLIEKIAPYIISNEFVYQINDYFKDIGIPFTDFKALEDIGILNVSAGYINYTHSEEEQSDYHIIPYCSRALLIRRKDSSLNYRIYTATKLGAELFKLCSIEPDYDYLQIIGEDIKKKGFEVALAELSSDGKQFIPTQVYQ